MKKGIVKVVYILSIVILATIFVYNLFAAFNSRSKEDFTQSISILMLSIFVLGILIVIYYFRAFSKEKSKDRILSLIKKEVYTIGGDYLGRVEDVLLENIKIYGLKIQTEIPGKRRKKVVIPSKAVNSYGEVILIDSSVFDKL